MNQTVDPLINYLGAAKAAQEQGAFERRDNLLQKAYRVAPEADLAIGLTQAELEIEQHQFEHAMATLNHLRKKTQTSTCVEIIRESLCTFIRLAKLTSVVAEFYIKQKY